MSVDLQIKKGDTRDWSFTLSDSGGDALNLASAVVHFRMKRHEWDSDTFFVRTSGSGGTNSDYITIGTPASDGTVTITPRDSDWTAIGSDHGVFVAEFKVVDANSDVQFIEDILVDVQESLWG